MQIFPMLSKVFRIKSGIDRRAAYPATRTVSGKLVGDLERELYGMELHEQMLVRQIISMAGQVVPVRQDTIAFDKKNAPCYLQKGRRLKISENPFSFGSGGPMHVNVVDEKSKYLSIRLSDYIRDIYVNDQEFNSPGMAGTDQELHS
jgi:hypothetical protein